MKLPHSPAGGLARGKFRPCAGSNLEPNRLAAVRRKRIAERQEALWPIAAEFQRTVRRLLTKADIRRAGVLVADARLAFARELPALRGNGADWQQRVTRARNALRRQLVAEIPALREAWRAQRAALRRLGRPLPWPGHRVPGVDTIGLPDVPPGATVFTAPFPLVDVYTTTDFNDRIKITDRSFALPDSGQLVIDTDFDNDEDTSFSDGLWGLLYFNYAEAVASCGVSYRVPQSGRIQVTARLQNFYHHATLSLADKWGFSSGVLWSGFYLMSRVLRPSRESRMDELIVRCKLTSDGDDVSTVVPDIPQDVPLTLDATTAETFDAGETIWVMVGTCAEISSTLDDMHSHVRALEWWQLDQITVGVVP